MAEAEAANDTAAWMRFVESHPGHPRSLAAERNAVTLRRLEGEDRAAPKVEVALLEGGLPAKSEPCLAKSEHGFFGIEDRAVQTIASFIKAVK